MKQSECVLNLQPGLGRFTTHSQYIKRRTYRKYIYIYKYIGNGPRRKEWEKKTERIEKEDENLAWFHMRWSIAPLQLIFNGYCARWGNVKIENKKREIEIEKKKRNRTKRGEKKRENKYITGTVVTYSFQRATTSWMVVVVVYPAHLIGIGFYVYI